MFTVTLHLQDSDVPRHFRGVAEMELEHCRGVLLLRLGRVSTIRGESTVQWRMTHVTRVEVFNEPIQEDPMPEAFTQA